MEFFINVASRWIHVSTAIVLIGGTVFIRYVLTPNAEQLPQTEHDRLRDLVTATWRKVVRAGILLFLLTGFYNYLVVAMPQHVHDKRYHMLMGIKILAAFGVFFLAEALVGRSAAFAPLRQRRKTWLMVLIIVAFAIVAISSLLRVRGVPA
ncbi:MAG TPA: hypothetical protein VFG04_16735 [Planctomycetaceae bacterium]|jgi:uncharacterized membrane protein|nr:hypothetical protein [Planctomycetaceae bacterium]